MSEWTKNEWMNELKIYDDDLWPLRMVMSMVDDNVCAIIKKSCILNLFVF